MHGDNSDAEGNSSGDEHIPEIEAESENDAPELDDSGVDWRAAIGPHPTAQLFPDSSEDDIDYDAFFANLPPYVPPEPESSGEEDEEEEEEVLPRSSDEDSDSSDMSVESELEDYAEKQELQPFDLPVEGREVTGDNKDLSLELSLAMKTMKETFWSDIHRRWLTLKDHMSPCIIPNQQELPDSATNGVRTIYDPLSDHYSKLGCYIFVLQKDSENYKKLVTYCNKSFGVIIVGESSYEVEVQNIFEIEMVGQPSLDDVKGLLDEVLLLCGAERSNLLRHLHEGFLPAICSSPVPAAMFGSIFNCSNAVAEAARYGYTNFVEPESFLVFGITTLWEHIIDSSSSSKVTQPLQAKIRFLVELKFEEKAIEVKGDDSKGQGFEVLPEIKSMKETLWSDFLERWSTFMVHTRPCVIPDHAANAVRAIYDPLSDHYNKLGFNIFALPKDSESYKKILAYVEETYEAAKVEERAYEVQVEKVFEIELIAGPSNDNIRSFPNKVMLLCGTGSSNLMRHLHEGFFPSMCSLPVPVSMFGRAFFCSNAVVEVARYGYTDLEPEGFLVCDVTSLMEHIIESPSPPQARIRFLVELNFKEKDLGDNGDNKNEG